MQTACFFASCILSGYRDSQFILILCSWSYMAENDCKTNMTLSAFIVELLESGTAVSLFRVFLLMI